MQAFTQLTALAVPIDRANVDTDAIIPKQFLKSIKRTGFGESLFFDWRYGQDGKDDPSFILNQPRYKGASILVVRNNFGCGSSREHAVWAVMQYGFKAVIAPRKEIGGALIPGFADIFRNNSVKNGLLTVELEDAEVEEIFQMTERNKGLQATIDLDEQRVVLHLPEELSFHFDIDPVVKKHLRHGLDDIALTLEHAADITAFEQKHDVQMAGKNAR